MQIVICDDVTEERQILRANIHQFGKELGLDYVIEEFESAESLLVAAKAGKVHPDMLFMDIYLDGMTGMAATKVLRKEGFSGAVIFTTTSQDHAVESYEVRSKDYLVKPYSKERFRRSFRLAVQDYTENLKTISFLCDRLEFSVFLKDLEYIEVSSRSCRLHAKGETLTTAKPLAEFAKELAAEDYFLQCHRGCIVNLHYVSKVEDDYVLMKDGAKAPLAVKDRAAVKKAATDYFFLKMREEEAFDV